MGILIDTDNNTEKTLMKTLQSVLISVIISVMFIFSCAISAWADTKQWSGEYDLSSWNKDNNWFPAGVPTTANDVIINGQSYNVVISDTAKVFKAKSIAMGGRQASTLTASNFVYGLISPADTADIALYTKKGGDVTLEGAGTITMTGSYKNSEETVPDEPAFVFKAE